MPTGPRRKSFRFNPPPLFTAGAIFGIGAALRLLFLFQIREIPFFSHLFSDSAIYHDLAAAIVRGDAAPSAHFMSPLYPYMLALLHVTLGGEFFWMRLLQSIAGACGAAGIYLLGRRWYGDGAGILSGLLAAICPLLVYYDNTILIESPLTLLVLLFLFILPAPRGKASAGRWLASGAAAGLLVLFRSSMIFPALLAAGVPALAGPSSRKGGAFLRTGALFLCGMALAIAPVTMQNYAREHSLVLVTAAGGLNFYAGNNARASGGFSLPEEVDLALDPNGHRYAEGQTGRRMTSPEVSQYWFDKAAAWIAGDPGAFLSLLWKKFLLFWSPSEADQLGLSVDFMRSTYRTLLDLPLPGFVPIAALAALGFSFGLRDRARRDATRLLLLFTAGYVAAVVLFFVSGRFRVPLLPALILPAGYGIAALAERISRRRWKEAAWGALPGLLLLAVSLAAAPRVEEDFSEEFNRLGLVAFEKRSYAEAQENFLRSLAYRERPRTRLNLANAYAAAQLTREADGQYQRVIEAAPHFALAYFNFGNYALQMNNPKQAYLLWLRAIKEDSTLAPAYRNIGLLFARAGKYGEAVRRLEQYLRWERDPAQAEAVRQDLERLRVMRDAEAAGNPGGG